MSWEFLAPDAVEARDGATPTRRSPIDWAHREAGATIAERDGWSVVADYGSPDAELTACRESVGVADLSQLGKLELQGEAAALAGIVAGQAGGAALELGRAALHEGVWWCPVTARRVLVVTPPEATSALRERLEAAGSGAAFVSLIELTGAHGSNAIVGPLAREAFARATAADLRPERFAEGAFAPVSVARTPGMLLREGGERFLHLFGSGYAQYMWTVFVDAAEHLGGRAVGADALAAVAGEEAGARA
jgi:aminomethyltransferase